MTQSETHAMKRLIKKYPNRRLYDTEKSGYITLADVHKLIRQGIDCQVVDAESGEDITRTILVQIITEQEGGETPIFTADMLTRFIRVYDDASQDLFGEFLDRNLKVFSEQQKKMQSQILEGVVGAPLQVMKDMTERNLSLWTDMQNKFFDMAMGKAEKTGKTDKAESPDKKDK